ncbi:MAG: DUF5011 domain-containing protein [bacterium]|nr:DUF5011 domain-containing protein [bacterium]
MKINKKISSILGLTLSLAMFILFSASANAATFTVNITTDTDDASAGNGACVDAGGKCSLRAAIQEANALAGDDIITLPAGTYTLTQVGTDDNAAAGDLDIITDITINGADTKTTIVTAGGSTGIDDRVFHMSDVGELKMSNLTVTGGYSASSGAGIFVFTGLYDTFVFSLDHVNVEGNEITGTSTGGGIHLESLNNATIVNASITNSSIINNISGVSGGGMYITASNQGELNTNITNTTIAGNDSLTNYAEDGGGMYIYNDALSKLDLNIQHSTITGNSASNGGGLSASDDGSVFDVSIGSTIIADNTASGSFSNCGGTASQTSNDYNIEGDTNECDFNGTNDQAAVDDTTVLNVAGLADNGGDTKTVALIGLASNPAINYIPNAACRDATGSLLTTDQRDEERSGYCDVGSYEYQDNANPVITVQGLSPDSVECAVIYTDDGATATDNIDGDVSGNIITDTSDVETDTPGTYTVEYSVTDLSNNDVTATRTVTVADTTDPSIILTGDDTVTVKQGDSYTDGGATAADTCDSNIAIASSPTGTLETDSSDVNTDEVGSYTVTYTATDASSNVATTTRTVNVISRGKVTKATPLKKGKVKLTYKDGSTLTCTAFNKGKPKAKLSTDKNRLVVLKKNGTKIKVLDAKNCVKKSSKKVRKKAQKVVKLGVYNYYKANKKNEVIVATKKNGKLKVTSLKLAPNKKGSGLAKRNTKTIEPFTYKKFQLNKKKKNIQLKNSGNVIQEYRVNKKARLKFI